MKKAIVSFLLMLYMASAMGATVHLHFCMGKIASFNLSHKETDKCKKCGMKNTHNNNGCCKDEFKSLKTNDHHLSKISIALSNLEFIQPIIIFNSFYYRFSQYAPTKITYAHLPPLLHCKCLLYISIRNIRI